MRKRLRMYYVFIISKKFFFHSNFIRDKDIYNLNIQFISIKTKSLSMLKIFGVNENVIRISQQTIFLFLKKVDNEKVTETFIKVKKITD